MSRRRGQAGQSMTEYLVIAAVMIAAAIAVTGPVRLAANSLAAETVNEMNAAVTSNATADHLFNSLDHFTD